MPKPPKHTYKPNEFEDLVNECINKCKNPKNKYIPCPEQLYLHTSLSKQTISAYRNSTEGDSNYPYKKAADKWYNYMGVEGWGDLRDGNGRFGQNIVSRVMGHSETQKIEQTTKTVDFTKKTEDMTLEEANKILGDIL